MEQVRVGASQESEQVRSRSKAESELEQGKSRSKAESKQAMEPTVRVRWEGTSSTRYDGLEQDIPRRYVVDEDVDEIAAGSTIRIKWGKKARIWRAVVMLVDVTESGKGKGKKKRKADRDTEAPSKRRRLQEEKTESKRGKSHTVVYTCLLYMHAFKHTCSGRYIEICLYVETCLPHAGKSGAQQSAGGKLVDVHEQGKFFCRGTLK